MLDVKVRCGAKTGGRGETAFESVSDVEKRSGRVDSISLVRIWCRGCDGGGVSQREEPGILFKW